MASGPSGPGTQGTGAATKRSERLDKLVAVLVGVAAVVMVALAIVERADSSGAGAGLVSHLDDEQRVDASALVRWASMGNLMGRRDAPVRIVEFGDFQCSFCASLHHSLTELRMKYPDLIAVRWIHLVPVQGRSPSRTFAIASECAAMQGRFAAFHDHVFAMANHTGSFAEMSQIAAAIGVPAVDRFQACIEASETAPLVDAQTREAISMGITDTPTWFINWRAIVGSIATDSIEVAIVRELRPARPR
jgi:protein-disulfide isomerase